MKIVLISLYNLHSLSLRPLNAFLKHHGHDVSLIFLKQHIVNHFTPPSQKEMELLKKLVRDLDPGMVGICISSSMTYRLGAGICREIRDAVSAPIVLGGVHPTISPEQCIEDADIVCRMEGEHPLLELAQALTDGTDYTAIKNLWVRKNGQVIKNPVRPLVQDLSHYPLTDFTDAGKFYIDNNTVIEENPLKNMCWQFFTFINKGCLHRCSFCINSEWNRIPPRPQIQSRSHEQVLTELERARQHCPGIGQIVFVDEIFLTESDGIHTFMNEYKKRIGLSYFCMYRPDVFTDDIARTLKQSGVDVVNVGIESGSEDFRRNVLNRRETNNDILRMGRIAKRHAIPLRLDLIFDNPYEREEDHQKTLELMLTIPKPFELCCFALSLFPKVALTDRALSEGIITRDDVEDIKQKAMFQWAVTSAFPRPKRTKFWINVLSLTGKRWIPNRFIRHVRRSRFVQEHPGILNVLIRVNTYVRWLTKGLPLLLRRTNRLSLLKTVFLQLRYILASPK
jgi:radical SAM superfamily enzyme YgiQ (UPF0313 family)